MVCGLRDLSCFGRERAVRGLTHSLLNRLSVSGYRILVDGRAGHPPSSLRDSCLHACFLSRRRRGRRSPRTAAVARSPRVSAAVTAPASPPCFRRVLWVAAFTAGAGIRAGARLRRRAGTVTAPSFASSSPPQTRLSGMMAWLGTTRWVGLMIMVWRWSARAAWLWSVAGITTRHSPGVHPCYVALGSGGPCPPCCRCWAAWPVVSDRS